MGLKQGQDLENRAAHPYQEFPRVPSPLTPPFTLRDEALRTSKCPLQSYINYYHDYLQNDLKRFPRSKGFRIRIHIKIPPRFHIVSQSVARILYLLLVLYPVCGPKSAVRSRCFTLTAFHSTRFSKNWKQRQMVQKFPKKVSRNSGNCWISEMRAIQLHFTSYNVMKLISTRLYRSCLPVYMLCQKNGTVRKLFFYTDIYL